VAEEDILRLLLQHLKVVLTVLLGKHTARLKSRKNARGCLFNFSDVLLNHGILLPPTTKPRKTLETPLFQKSMKHPRLLLICPPNSLSITRNLILEMRSSLLGNNGTQDLIVDPPDVAAGTTLIVRTSRASGSPFVRDSDTNALLKLEMIVIITLVAADHRHSVVAEAFRGVFLRVGAQFSDIVGQSGLYSSHNATVSCQRLVLSSMNIHSWIMLTMDLAEGLPLSVVRLM